MEETSRRDFCRFLGLSVSATALMSFAPTRAALAAGENGMTITPVRLPIPLRLYATGPSFLASGAGGQGETLPPSQEAFLDSYQVIDDIVIPPEFESYPLVSWGDRPFADKHHYVGYNCDYTGYVPLNGDEDGVLTINHEYVSYPFSPLAPGAALDYFEKPEEEGAIDPASMAESFDMVVGQAAGNPQPFSLPSVADLQGEGHAFARLAHDPAKLRLIAGEFRYNTGVSVLRIGRGGANQPYQIADGDAHNRRIHGLSGLGINAGRTDGYADTTGWGDSVHQQGDEDYLQATGPAVEVFESSTDGLGDRVIGTSFNCSGATTPWGTILTCEENFQTTAKYGYVDSVNELVDSQGHQLGYEPNTSGAVFGLVGEKYGWVVEIDPKAPTSHAKKHTSLGRFRHENVAIRAEAGNRLICYLGDDRRGGHTWKWVSDGTVTDPADPANSALLENGSLYVARFNADGTGRWVKLAMDSPVEPNRPSDIASVQIAKQGEADRGGLVHFPEREGVAGGAKDGGWFACTVENEAEIIDGYLAYAEGKTGTLADFYANQGAVLTDAFLAANLVGGTPSARPEDIEVVPWNNEVLIAYTDGVAGGDGYSDSRIFTVNKYTAEPDSEQPSGGLYKIVEDAADGHGVDTFRWQRWIQSGEEATGVGHGFANVDNLAFDPKGNIFGVTDMSTSRQNGVNVGPKPKARKIDHTSTSSKDARALTGVFGNNSMFYVPTSGLHAGQVIPFAIGPVKSEMTGPTFIGDSLIIAVQHPGENMPISGQQIPGDDMGDSITKDIEILGLDGSTAVQSRTVPRGSSWPSHLPGDAFANASLKPPRPSVFVIRRKTGGPLV